MATIVISTILSLIIAVSLEERTQSMPRLISDEGLAVATIWQEARGEPFLGKLAVAQVIKNRTLRKYNSDGTVPGTVLAPYQFSGWNTKDPNRPVSGLLDSEDAVVRSCREAWHLASYPSQEFMSLGHKFPAVLFHARTMSEYPEWTKSERVVKVAEIGNHIFYDDLG